jgi:hypothetical protein
MRDDIKAILEIISALLQIFAILAAGVWAYYKFLKGRLFKHKLDIELSGTFFSLEAGDHVLASIHIKNSGFTRVDFKTECCVLRIFTPKDRPNLDFTDATIWRRIATVPILNDHKWIEPSGVIQEEELIYCDHPVNVAVRLEVSVSDSKSLWRASTVTVNTHSKKDNERRSNHERRKEKKIGPRRNGEANGNVGGGKKEDQKGA